MAETKIKARLRENTGKGATRKYRQDGWIPAEFYSHHDTNVHLLLKSKEVEKILTHGHGLFNLEVEGQDRDFQCVIKELQFEPVKGNVLHADFQGVKLGEKITLEIPIVLKGSAPGVKAGGIMEFMIRELEIECLPTDIPEKIEIDISNLNIGDTIWVKDLKPENYRIMNDLEETILLIEHPKLAKEFEEGAVPEALEEAEPTEPEVIRGRKKEEEEEEEK